MVGFDYVGCVCLGWNFWSPIWTWYEVFGVLIYRSVFLWLLELNSGANSRRTSLGCCEECSGFEALSPLAEPCQHHHVGITKQCFHLYVDMAKQVKIFRPEKYLTRIRFFLPEAKTGWLVRCFLQVNLTRPEPEQFFKTFLFGKKK